MSLQVRPSMMSSKLSVILSILVLHNFVELFLELDDCSLHCLFLDCEVAVVGQHACEWSPFLDDVLVAVISLVGRQVLWQVRVKVAECLGRFHLPIRELERWIVDFDRVLWDRVPVLWVRHSCASPLYCTLKFSRSTEDSVASTSSTSG